MAMAHSGAYTAVKREADALVDQIAYDRSTYATCKDFIHLCGLVVHDQLVKGDVRENRDDMDKMSADLFRYLHSGRSVKRNKVHLPQWIIDNDKRTEADAKSGTARAV